MTNVEQSASVLPSSLIGRSSANRSSANFAMTGFYEIRSFPWTRTGCIGKPLASPSNASSRSTALFYFFSCLSC
jgi:hypothetical protein